MTAFDSTFNEQFFDTDVFSVSVTYTDEDTNASSVLVNFFNEGEEVPTANGVTVLKKPQLLVKVSDVATPKRGETFLIDSTTYYIIKAMPDGEGVWLIHLSETQV